MGPFNFEYIQYTGQRNLFLMKMKNVFLNSNRIGKIAFSVLIDSIFMIIERLRFETQIDSKGIEGVGWECSRIASLFTYTFVCK